MFLNFKICDVWDTINSLSVPPLPLSLFLSLSLSLAVCVSHGRTQDYPFKGPLIKPHRSPEVPETVLTELKLEIGARACGASSSLMRRLCTGFL